MAHDKRTQSDVTPPRPALRRSWRTAAIIGLVVVALALLTQQALAAQLGRWLAGVWVATVELVLGVIAPLFGG